MRENLQKNTKDLTNDALLRENISANLKLLIKQNNMSQKQLADEFNIAPSTISDYCKGVRTPPVEFICALKGKYKISIDDFLSKKISPSANAFQQKTSVLDRNLMDTYGKYCGMYYVYYFDASKYPGNNNQTEAEAVVYGVMYIYQDPDSSDVPKFSCVAVLGIKDRNDADLVRKTLESKGESLKIADYVEKNYERTAYYGDFNLSQEHAFISITHAERDKALIILHRVDSNKPNYIGGIGTINSVCKGRERMPVVQFIGLSRHQVSLSVDEIHRCLLLNYPSFHLENETDEMIRNFKALYMPEKKEDAPFNEYQKRVMVRSTLERQVRKNLERNVFRYAKISSGDDDAWYHSLKDINSARK